MENDVVFKLKACVRFTKLKLQNYKTDKTLLYSKWVNYRLMWNRKWDKFPKNWSSPHQSRTPLWAGLDHTGGAAAEASTAAKPEQCHHWQTGPIYTAERELLAVNTRYTHTHKHTHAQKWGMAKTARTIQSVLKHHLQCELMEGLEPPHHLKVTNRRTIPGSKRTQISSEMQPPTANTMFNLLTFK